MLDLIYFLLIGLVAGWLAGKIMKGRSFGLLGNIVVGVIGAVLGGLLFRLVGLVTIGLLGSLISATVGAIVLLFILQKFGKQVWSTCVTPETLNGLIERVTYHNPENGFAVLKIKGRRDLVTVVGSTTSITTGEQSVRDGSGPRPRKTKTTHPISPEEIER